MPPLYVVNIPSTTKLSRLHCNVYNYKVIVSWKPSTASIDLVIKSVADEDVHDMYTTNRSIGHAWLHPFTRACAPSTKNEDRRIFICRSKYIDQYYNYRRTAVQSCKLVQHVC